MGTEFSYIIFPPENNALDTEEQAHPLSRGLFICVCGGDVCVVL